MAQRRMFSLQVTDTDKFLDMPTSSQALYFHLGLHGDDDGFVASPRKIVRAAGCNDDDLRLLASKGYIIPFESGVVVITDWKVNNYIQSDRYTQTLYIDEKQSLSREKSGQYVRTDTECIQSVSRSETQVRLGRYTLETQKRTAFLSTARFSCTVKLELPLFAQQKPTKALLNTRPRA